MTNNVTDPELIKSYKETLASHDRTVRELDLALNGSRNAAKQASLIDILMQVKRENIRSENYSDGIMPNVGEMRDAFEVLTSLSMKANFFWTTSAAAKFIAQHDSKAKLIPVQVVWTGKTWQKINKVDTGLRL